MQTFRNCTPGRSGLVALLGFILAVCCSACGHNRKPVFPVQGKVIYKGKPVPQALVVFHPLQTTDPRETKPAAHTDTEGQFTLTTYLDKDGAPAGEYAVTVLWQPLVKDKNGELVQGPNQLPAAYSKPATTKLRFKVVEGPNDIALDLGK